MSEERTYFVYIMASHKNGSLYTGMTNHLVRRVIEHKTDFKPNSHTSRYNIKRLVYLEMFDTAEEAIKREKFVKKLTRARRVKLIEKDNPDWRELFDGDDTVQW